MHTQKPIMGFLGNCPCVDFDLVDLSANLLYCYERLFEPRRDDVYSAEVDKVYEGLFQRLILKAPSGPRS